MEIRKLDQKLKMGKPEKTEIQVLTEKVVSLEKKIDRLLKEVSTKTASK